MHKYQKFISLFLFGIITFIFSCFFLRSSVLADVTYTIPKVDTVANVQEDGSMKVKTIVTYNFESKARGLSYQNSFPKNKRLKNIKIRVKRNNQNWQNFYPMGKVSSDFADSDTSHYYLYDDTNGSFKVYDPDIKKGDLIKVEYNYILTNAIINWKDTAELNQKFLGSRTDVEIEKASVVLSFAKWPGKSLRLWVHSKANGKIKINDNSKKVLITTKNIEPHTSIEVHAAFPTKITSLNKNTRNKSHLDYIKEIEAQIARKTKVKRILHLIGYLALLLIIAIPTMLSVKFAFFDAPIGYKPKKYRSLSHNYEIPDFESVMVQLLATGKVPDQKGFAGFLTEAIAKARVSLSQISKDNYKIIVNDDEILKDSSLLRDMIVKAGDGKSVTFNQIKKASLETSYRFWQSTMLDKARRLGLILSRREEARIQGRLGLSKFGDIVSVIVILAILIFTRVSYKYGLIVALFAFIFINFICRFVLKRKNSIYTEKGAAETEKVLGFAKMLNEIGNFERRDLPELPLWEDIMPYAVALSISKKVLQKIKLVLSDSKVSESFSNWELTGINYFEKSMGGLHSSDWYSASESSDKSSRSYDHSSVDFDSDFSSGDSDGFDDDSGFGAF